MTQTIQSPRPLVGRLQRPHTIIRSREFTDNWNDPPVKIIQNCIAEHRQGIPRLDTLEAYYYGEHPILWRDLGGRDTGLPNNQLVANHAKYITDVAVGYFAGDPIKYGGGGAERITEAYKTIDITSHDAELAKDLSMFGVARELHFMNSDNPPIPKVACIDPRQLFLVVDDTVEYRNLFAVHYYERRDADNNPNGWTLNVYTEDQIIQYQPADLGTGDWLPTKAPQPHYYGAVPVVEFWNNEEQQGDYEQQRSLIDAYNTLASDRVNDKEQFVDAILKLVGASLGDSEDEAGRTIKLLKKYKVLELPSGVQADAAWLTKALNEADTEVLRNAIKSDIHEFSMVPDLTDENFAANASGVAMKYKLFGLEQLAKTKERYFMQGLRERLRLFARILGVKGNPAVDVSQITITMTRSLPSNDAETATMIGQLTDLVSAETLVSQLSFVDDPAIEVKKATTERAAALKEQQKAFGMPMTGEDTGNEDQK